MRGIFVILFFLCCMRKGMGLPQDKTYSDSLSDDDSDMYMEAQEANPTRIENRQHQIDLHQDSSNPSSFYPSFSPFEQQPLGHSRPFYYNQQQEGAYSHRPSSAYNQRLQGDSPRFSGYKNEEDDDESAKSADDADVGLLGSGNFGVMTGGTFYHNNNNENDQSGYESDFNQYYRNGHGRPSYYREGRRNPQPYKHDEQFANFRDFADINSPAYSHFIVVYANKNDTKEHTKNAPKNIIEMLNAVPESTSAEITDKDSLKKKLSKSKRKLLLLPVEKKHLIKKHVKKELKEPLLALS